MTKYLFTGLIKCGKCNYMYKGRVERNFKNYVCNKYISKGKTECDRRPVKEDDLIFLIRTQLISNDIEWVADNEYISNHVKQINIHKDSSVEIVYHKLSTTMWTNDRIIHSGTTSSKI